VVKYRLDYHHLDNIKMRDISLMYAISIITGLFFADKTPLTSNINSIVGILFFLKLSRWFVSRERVYQPLLWLEGYAFFVYATHGIFLAVLIKLSVKIMPMHGLCLLVHYFGVTLLCRAARGYGRRVQAPSPQSLRRSHRGPVAERCPRALLLRLPPAGLLSRRRFHRLTARRLARAGGFGRA
jgi:hypothetical protein